VELAIAKMHIGRIRKDANFNGSSIPWNSVTNSRIRASVNQISLRVLQILFRLVGLRLGLLSLQCSETFLLQSLLSCRLSSLATDQNGAANDKANELKRFHVFNDITKSEIL